MQSDIMERLMRDATDRVLDKGYDNADLKDVLMMGILYLSENQKRPGPPKKIVMATLAGGAAGISALGEFLRSIWS